jgi:hypothetical protein
LLKEIAEDAEMAIEIASNVDLREGLKTGADVCAC